MTFIASTLVVTALLVLGADAEGIRGTRSLQREFNKMEGDEAEINCIKVTRADGTVSYTGANCNCVRVVAQDGTVTETGSGCSGNIGSVSNLVVSVDEDDEDSKDVESGSMDVGLVSNAFENTPPATSVTVPSNQQETVTTPTTLLNIVDTALTTNSLASLYWVVASSGLASTLNGPGPFTVFAPINRAFPTGANMLSLQKDPELPNILKYHVVPGIIRSTDLTNGQMATTLNGANITAFVNFPSGTVKINDANVILADVEASNGIVHLVDKLLTPPITPNTASARSAGNPDLVGEGGF